MMLDALRDTIAEAIYNAHWKEKNPLWVDASDNVKEFVRKQAVEAIRAYERSIRTD